MNKIDPNKLYNLNEIVKQRLFYWLPSSSMSTVSRWVNRDMKDRNILKAVKIGKEIGSRYFIKGENIIKFLAAFEDGTLHDTPRKVVRKMEEKEYNAPSQTEVDNAEQTAAQPEEAPTPTEESAPAEESADVAAGESEDAGEPTDTEPVA